MTCPRTLLPNEEVDDRAVRCCEVSQKINQSPWNNDGDGDDDKYRKTTTNIASCFDSDLDSSCEASWVLNEAFRAQGDELDYYQLRKKKNKHMMIPIQEELLQRYQVGRGHSMTDTKQRGTKNSNGTDAMAVRKNLNGETVQESIHRPSFRRPGLEENNSENGTAPTPPRILHRKVQSTVKPPPKHEEGSSCHCCSKEISSSNNLHCTRSSSEHSPSHTFCRDCLQRYVQEWVSGVVDHPLRHRTNALPCLMADCDKDGYVPHEVTEQVCSPVLWEQYQEKVFRVGSITSTPPFASFQSYSYASEDMEGLDDDKNPSYRLPRRHRSRSFDDGEGKQGDSGKKVNFKSHH